MLINEARKGRGAGTDDPVDLIVRAHSAFQELSKAWKYAQSGGDTWHFAIDVDFLRTHGLTDSDLRWLISGVYLHHVIETNGKTRKYRVGGRRFGSSSCFMFTDAGELLYQSILRKLDKTRQESLPVWDAKQHQLRFGDCVVKEFRLPAHNQEAILDAFERQQWASRIADPLAHGPSAKQRLHDTIKCLNRGQRTRMISFRDDGTGHGVCWELIRISTPKPGKSKH